MAQTYVWLFFEKRWLFSKNDHFQWEVADLYANILFEICLSKKLALTKKEVEDDLK